jgi:glutamine amidotransferase
MSEVVIIDYQLGNLFSVKQACEFLGYEALISSNPADLKSVKYAILPGVGAFADAMHNLKEFGLDEAIYHYVQQGKPIMGICLGQQLMLTESEEFESCKGLGLVKGKVRKIPFQTIHEEQYRVPQIQWNIINKPNAVEWNNTPLRECKNGDYMYFVHSFYTALENNNEVLTQTEYGNLTYCSAILKDNIFTTQFHPEKSGVYGLSIYKNWFELNK